MVPVWVRGVSSPTRRGGRGEGGCVFEVSELRVGCLCEWGTTSSPVSGSSGGVFVSGESQVE